MMQLPGGIGPALLTSILCCQVQVSHLQLERAVLRSASASAQRGAQPQPVFPSGGRSSGGRSSGRLPPAGCWPFRESLCVHGDVCVCGQVCVGACVCPFELVCACVYTRVRGHPPTQAAPAACSHREDETRCPPPLPLFTEPVGLEPSSGQGVARGCWSGPCHP